MPTTSSNPHAVLLASPGLGHLIPILELGDHLSDHHGFDVTVFVVAADSSIAESPLFGRSKKQLLNIVLLPPVDISSLIEPTASVVTKIAAMMQAAVPSLRAAIYAMTTPPTALVVDIFGTDATVLASDFNMLKYVFVTCSAWSLAVSTHIPGLSEKEKHELRVLNKPLEVPGCRRVPFADVADIFLGPAGPEFYAEVVRVRALILMADGILVNTWRELEPSTLNSLGRDKLLGRPVAVYPVGPLVRPSGPSSGSKIIAWLDKQPKESVIYVSFGSGGTLSVKQTIELAWGLELSRQRFVWVVRPPLDNDALAAFFNTTCGEDGTPDYLPDGFITRTKKVGLVVPAWAPQAEILAHQSVGGFLSHCGWNSILESIVNGVPMMAWPLFGEQKMNATMLEEEIRVAVRLGPRDAGEVVGREEIRDVLIGVMDATNRLGSEMRARVKELSVEAKEALRKGGPSYSSLSQVATRSVMTRGVTAP